MDPHLSVCASATTIPMATLQCGRAFNGSPRGANLWSTGSVLLAAERPNRSPITRHHKLW
uniref:Uncharacterized protein n=1 Tax=Oryza sativa subsp. japonica TaxID=39947 RepID=Q6ESG9_ORYSJ|nr:hypothetical protein [Oryza sativa Japonica Group]BAD28401.1 hypothetical protein [Oryza sativa Japonica Group]